MRYLPQDVFYFENFFVNWKARDEKQFYFPAMKFCPIIVPLNMLTHCQLFL